MYSKDNMRIQAKVDKDSGLFLKRQAYTMSMSIAELSGAIIRKFIYEYSKGSDEYKNLENFVIRDGRLKEVSK